MAKRIVENPLRLKGGAETRRYAKIVADAYEKAPSFDPAAVPAYKALIAGVERLYSMVASRVDVVFVDGQPYRNETALNRDVVDNKRLQISKQFNKHRVFTPEQNLKFRAVHDWFAHVAGGAPFTQRGELRAYNAQAKMTSKKALPALFTEVLAQAAYATVHGDFAAQKIAILPGFDYVDVGYGPAVDAAMRRESFREPPPEIDPTAQYYEADGVTPKAKNPRAGGGRRRPVAAPPQQKLPTYIDAGLLRWNPAAHVGAGPLRQNPALHVDATPPSFDMLRFVQHGREHFVAKMLFANGFLASVACFTSKEWEHYKLYEVAVCTADGKIVYNSGVTDDVIVHLTEDGVTDVLRDIAALPPGGAKGQFILTLANRRQRVFESSKDALAWADANYKGTFHMTDMVTNEFGTYMSK